MRESNDKPKVSVVMATCRLGGLDVLFAMARDQTFRDFELIVVDYFYFERREIFRNWQNETGLDPSRIVHVPPRDGCWGIVSDAGQAFNTGLALARGELICCIGDYQYQYPDFVKDHWDFYIQSDRKATMAGPSTDVLYPGCIFSREHVVRSCYSIFESPFDPSEIARLSCIDQPNRVVNDDGTVSIHSFYITQNESMPLRLLYTLNGLDELYDGGRGWQDSDLGMRLNALGHKIMYRHGLPAYHIVAGNDCPVRVPWGAQSIGVSWSHKGSRRNLDLLHLRIMSMSQCLGLILEAPNGGFRLEAPITPETVIGMAEAVRPLDAGPFGQLPPENWRRKYNSEPRVD